MSKTSDCIVIGGGIVGLTCALRLKQAGFSVTLLERDATGRQASWAGAGIISHSKHPASDEILALRSRSLKMYPALCKEVHETTGIDPEMRTCGELELFLKDEDHPAARIRVNELCALEPHADPPLARIITIEELAKLEPAAAENAIGAMHIPDIAQIRNPRLLAGLKAACVSAGVTVEEGVPVDGLIQDGARVLGAKSGERQFHADHTILAAGSWSSQLHPDFERITPVVPVRGQMVLLEMERAPISAIISHFDHYIVPRTDGHLIIGTTVEWDAGFAQRTTAGAVSNIVEEAMTLVPALAEASVAASWAGLRPGTPDERPYLGKVPGFDGLIAATGHFRSGLILAPVTAEIVVAEVRGQSYDLDYANCAPARA